jgi:thioredoxin reductase (NADPH)
MIQNYPGLPDIPGQELAQHFLDHLKKMEIPITDRKVTMIYAMGDYFSLQIDQEFVEASAVILAIGVSFGKPFPGEDENLGRGVSYCATCDAALYRGREAVVVGYAPKEEADVRFLAEMAQKVTYIPVYKKEDAAAMAPELFPDHPNVEVKQVKPLGIEKRDGRMVLATDGGEISADGIYTAPGKEGVYEIHIYCTDMPVICTYAYAIVKRRERMDEMADLTRAEAGAEAALDAESRME